MRAKLTKALSLLLSLAVVCLVCFTAPVTLPADAVSSEVSQKVAELDEKIAASQEKIKENEAKKKEAKQSADTIQESVDLLQTQINAYNSKIDVLNNQIASLNKSITNTQEKIAETQADMAVQKEQIAQTQALYADRLRAMYITGNVSNLEILLEADNFRDFLNRMEMLARISKHDNAIIKQLQDEIAVFEETEATLKKNQEKLQSSKSEIENSKAMQQEAKSQVVGAKTDLDQKVNSLNTYINGLDENSEELNNYIAKARAQQQAYMNQVNANLAVTASTGNGAYSGTFIWPVAGSGTYVSSGYGSRWGSFHYGIDITGGGGSAAIVAAAAGRVTIASNTCSHNYGKNYNCGCNGGYGNYVVIDHGNGLLTYYGHMARAIVGAGTYVQQGQQIGNMGSTGYSTGPHLHFEVRVNDGTSRSVAARNPMNYF
ncbi:MAG: peptidoglycan DD-metalloendopeptidase family protein [Clostridia bacterium]|nr:peptidoglycan DD-metalloendopeptidase family protein [Clostridia bacterium]